VDPPPANRPRVRRRPRRLILALGGQEFSRRPHDRAACEVLLDLAGRRAEESAGRRRPGPPRICLLPTASGDPVEQSARFHDRLADRECDPSDLSLFRLGRRPVALRDHLLGQDLIYVGGGSLVNLLAIWRAHDVDAILRVAWRDGVVLAGHSAGAMCWFEAGITKSSGKPAAAAGLGYLPGTLCVHYDGEPERRAAFLAAVRRGMPGGHGLDDSAGLLWDGERAAEALSLRRGAGAYRIAVRDGVVDESPLPTRLVQPPPAALPSDDISELRRTVRARPGLRA
jgi:dipeptidase E